MPPSKVRVIEVEEGETVFLKVNSMYPITIEFQKGTLVAFEALGGVFTRFSAERPAVMADVEEDAQTEHEDYMEETQEMDYGLDTNITPPPQPHPDPPPHVTTRKSVREHKVSPIPFHLQAGETQLEETQLD
jgi:hypothetical protein